jgi:hypothetical protein
MWSGLAIAQKSVFPEPVYTHFGCLEITYTEPMGIIDQRCYNLDTLSYRT